MPFIFIKKLSISLTLLTLAIYNSAIPLFSSTTGKFETLLDTTYKKNNITQADIQQLSSTFLEDGHTDLCQCMKEREKKGMRKCLKNPMTLIIMPLNKKIMDL
jgi:hypothetical protein